MTRSNVSLCVKAGVSLTAIFAAGVAINGCGKKKDEKKDGKSIGAPAVEPPVSRHIPKGLSGSVSLNLDEATSKEKALAAVKQLLSSGETGPSTFVYRLKMIDNRVTELNRRSEENDGEKACLASGVTAGAYDVGGKLPGNEDAGMKFQCQEEITGSPSGISEAQLAFGLTTDTFYLMERTISSGGNGIMVLASASMIGTATEAWEIATDGDNAVFKHIKAKDGFGLEATIAGSKTSSHDGACGLHVKSNGTYVYLKGSVSLGGDKCSEEIISCYDAKAGDEISETICVDASLSTFELTSLTPSLAKAAVADAKSIMAKKITGHIDFTADTKVAEE